MRILFDTNVVLDVLLRRPPHAVVAATLLSQVELGNLRGLLGATTLTTIHYLAARAVGRPQANLHVASLLELFEVAAVTRTVLAAAVAASFPDFEDAVLHEAAIHSGATGIVTRNAKDFAQATVPVYGPAELLRLIEARSR